MITLIKLAGIGLVGLAIASHGGPGLAFFWVVACGVVHIFSRTIAFVLKWVCAGFILGEGLKLSGISRTRRDRERHDPDDDFPENLKG
jgi:hypothetical protein